ncbi:SAP domain-containing ribonucleoprotein [Aplysia californica]|uniref:SAP domain-containing ribonucleoprotein n=1 Tax=Aplysia californica TaxID=6500 RepID=A0ABM0K7C5_APLCA|nr:SAP domain-containing ribonucleoprotein [Aplysia californica]
MEDLSKMKVAELKQALKDRGLPTSGTKPDLVKRLGEALGTSVDSSADAGLDDSLQGIDEILNEDASPPFPKKSSIAEPAPSQPSEPVKVETPSTEENVAPASNGVSEKSDEPKPAAGSDEKIAKPVEVSKLSHEERLKMRAEKYGVVSTEAKKELRAQRFGLPSSGGALSGLGTGQQNVDVDKLKKRAERFGTVVSKSLTKVEEDERKRKRAERFGASDAISTNVSSGLSSEEVEAKKKKRAERFGLTT